MPNNLQFDESYDLFSKHADQKKSKVPWVEQLKLFKKYKHTKSKKIEAQLLESNLDMVFSIIFKHYAKFDVPISDLVQEGNKGLLRAIQKFDPAKGYRFSTYAYPWIHALIFREIKRALSPVIFSAHCTIGNLPKAIPLVFLPSVGNKQTDTDGVFTYDPSTDETPESITELNIRAQTINKLVEQYCSSVRPVCKDIVKIRFMRDVPGTLQEIADMYSLSRERIRQLEIIVRNQLFSYVRDNWDSISISSV